MKMLFVLSSEKEFIDHHLLAQTSKKKNDMEERKEQTN
jgi:hypothetical protein